ncbi:hypothetical protein BC941DRAFT_446550, partial [Chlamydoabsidia padenii]
MNYNINNNTMDIDADNAYEVGLDKAKRVVQMTLDRYNEMQDLADEAILNNTDAEDQLKLVEKANQLWQLHQGTKKTMAQRYPLEEHFNDGNRGNNSDPGNDSSAAPGNKADATKAVPHVNDFPFLTTNKEKTMHPEHMVTKNAREFVKSLEEVMNLHCLDVETDYQRFLPRLVSKSYKVFLENQRSILGDQAQENWAMVKEWLVEFTNTPRQKVKNTIEWLDTTPRDDESGEDFFFRLMEATEAVDWDKISKSTLAFFAIARNLDSNWRHRLLEAIKDGPTPFIKKSFKDMCAFATDLELKPRPRSFTNSKRRFDQDQREQPDQSKRSRRAAITGPYPGGGKYCDEGCGEKYMPGHDCKNKKGNGSSSNNHQQGSGTRSPQNQQQGRTYPNRTYQRPMSRVAKQYSKAVRKQDEEIDKVSKIFRGSMNIADKLPC